MRVSERCSCGASIEVEANNSTYVDKSIKEWREKHQHQVRSPYGYGTYSGGAVITPCATETPYKVSL